jgi:hypothetical protein
VNAKNHSAGEDSSDPEPIVDNSLPLGASRGLGDVVETKPRQINRAQALILDVAPLGAELRRIGASGLRGVFAAWIGLATNHSQHWGNSFRRLADNRPLMTERKFPTSTALYSSQHTHATSSGG